jgi:hypothetical protein
MTFSNRLLSVIQNFPKSIRRKSIHSYEKLLRINVGTPLLPLFRRHKSLAFSTTCKCLLLLFLFSVLSHEMFRFLSLRVSQDLKSQSLQIIRWSFLSPLTFGFMHDHGNRRTPVFAICNKLTTPTAPNSPPNRPVLFLKTFKRRAC